MRTEHSAIQRLLATSVLGRDVCVVSVRHRVLLVSSVVNEEPCSPILMYT